MNFANPHFAAPGWLWLAVLGPAGLGLLLRYSAWARDRQLRQLATAELLTRLLGSDSPFRRALKSFLLILALAGMGLALARPQWGEQVEESQSVGEDILFVLDCSRSMLAQDARPDRLTRSKLAILDFVQQFGRGRVGLIAFAGQAFLQCPLTFDYDAFRDALMAIDDRTIPVLGTDIGRALDEAYSALEKNYRRKIMVLVTDGEDLEADGIAKAKELARKDVVIFTIGVGTPAGSPIQFINERGVQETLRDRSGQIVESHLDEPTLRTIAEVTHGSYQPLGVLGEGMNQVRHLLEISPDLHRVTNTRKMGVDRFHIPVALVLILLVAESLLGTRRREAKAVTS